MLLHDIVPPVLNLLCLQAMASSDESDHRPRRPESPKAGDSGEAAPHPEGAVEEVASEGPRADPPEAPKQTGTEAEEKPGDGNGRNRRGGWRHNSHKTRVDCDICWRPVSEGAHSLAQHRSGLYCLTWKFRNEGYDKVQAEKMALQEQFKLTRPKSPMGRPPAEKEAPPPCPPAEKEAPSRVRLRSPGVREPRSDVGWEEQILRGPTRGMYGRPWEENHARYGRSRSARARSSGRRRRSATRDSRRRRRRDAEAEAEEEERRRQSRRREEKEARRRDAEAEAEEEERRRERHKREEKEARLRAAEKEKRQEREARTRAGEDAERRDGEARKKHGARLRADEEQMENKQARSEPQNEKKSVRAEDAPEATKGAKESSSSYYYSSSSEEQEAAGKPSASANEAHAPSKKQEALAPAKSEAPSKKKEALAPATEASAPTVAKNKPATAKPQAPEQSTIGAAPGGMPAPTQVTQPDAERTIEFANRLFETAIRAGHAALR